MKNPHTSDLLFHCWQHQDRTLAYRQFESIVNRGLLLTINTNQLDSFQFFGAEGLEQMDVMQKARACFTEIPLNLLRTHNYGHFAVGFSRETVVDWGGLPAWYLPNHPGKRTLKEISAEIIRGLHASAIALDNMQVLARDVPPMLKQYIPEKYLSRDFEIIFKFTHGTSLAGASLQQWLERNKQAMYHILSYVKEMSPRDVEDFRYLYEREWRIVAGMEFGGREACRMLTEKEKSELGGVRPLWLNEVRSIDINVQVRYPKVRTIDHFRFFNGIEDISVSQKIEEILVPDMAAKRYVSAFIKKHQSAFRPSGPKVRLFPNTASRLFWIFLTEFVRSAKERQ
jgi:abortive phage resistance protein AbiGi (putative antitoxin)